MLASLAAHSDAAAAALSRIYGRTPRYLLDEFLKDTATGHNVPATVFVEVHTMYRASGPANLRPIGEVEFANGVAAMSASGLFGAMQVCGAIVGGQKNVDLVMDRSKVVDRATLLATLATPPRKQRSTTE